MNNAVGATATVGRGSAAGRVGLSRIVGWMTAALATLCLPGITAGPAVAGPIPTQVQATQVLVVLMTAHHAHSSPDARSAQIALVAPLRPITGARTTLPVLARSTGTDGAVWLLVMLPGRPDGSTGWIPGRDTRRLVTPWRIGVDLTARRVIVYRDGGTSRTFQAVIGKPSTPTPTGQFFVEESVRMPAGQPGGPYALALSARSNVLQEFEGGPGQVAIHGSVKLAAPLGTAASFGCIRIADAGTVWLSHHIPPGTPVAIYRT